MEDVGAAPINMYTAFRKQTQTGASRSLKINIGRACFNKGFVYFLLQMIILQNRNFGAKKIICPTALKLCRNDARTQTVRITTCCHCIFFTFEIVLFISFLFKTGQDYRRAQGGGHRYGFGLSGFFQYLPFQQMSGVTSCTMSYFRPFQHAWFFVNTVAILAQGTSWADAATQAFMFYATLSTILLVTCRS